MRLAKAPSAEPLRPRLLPGSYPRRFGEARRARARQRSGMPRPPSAGASCAGGRSGQAGPWRRASRSARFRSAPAAGYRCAWIAAAHFVGERHPRLLRHQARDSRHRAPAASRFPLEAGVRIGGAVNGRRPRVNRSDRPSRTTGRREDHDEDARPRGGCHGRPVCDR